MPIRLLGVLAAQLLAVLRFLGSVVSSQMEAQKRHLLPYLSCCHPHMAGGPAMPVMSPRRLL